MVGGLTALFLWENLILKRYGAIASPAIWRLAIAPVWIIY
jgi:hypothetical protein